MVSLTGLLPETRALISSATTALAVSDRVGQIAASDRPISAIRRVLLAGTTNSDRVLVPRENVLTNAATEVAQATTTAGGAKPESTATITDVWADVRTVAHYLNVSRQLLDDELLMQTYIDTLLVDGLERRVASQLINGNGTAPNLLGLLATPGIQLANAAHFTGSPVTGAGQPVENVNRLARAVRLGYSVGFAEPSFILVNPVDFEKLSTYTGAVVDYAPGGPVGMLHGLPLYRESGLPAGTALVGDGRKAIVLDRREDSLRTATPRDAETRVRGSVAVYQADQHDDYFIRNIISLLAETRLTLAVMRPAAFVSTTLV